MSDWFDTFRQMLLECYDNTPDYKLNEASMHITFSDSFEPDYGKTLEMDLLSTDIEGLRNGRGNLNFFWPEDFYDYLWKKGAESSPAITKEGCHER